MTQDAIRQLAGPQLSRLARTLGLAPTEVQTIGQTILAYLTALGTRETPWAPHVDLPQALAVFHQLRAVGWSVSLCSQQAEEPGSCVLFGAVEAYHRATLVQVLAWWSTAAAGISKDTDPSEALCVLRVAVLAAAHPCNQEVPHG